MAKNQVAKRDSLSNVTIEDARIIFRNFSGKEGDYNREGDRNFALILEHDIAEIMAADGWNIKYLKAREEGDLDQPYLPVAVSYKIRPPRIVLISGGARTNIPEELVHVLDWIDIAKVDIIVNPYQWAVSGKTGIKAYLKTLFIIMDEDELEKKYVDVPDSAQNVLLGRPQLELEDPNVIDGELVEDNEEFN